MGYGVFTNRVNDSLLGNDGIYFSKVGGSIMPNIYISPSPQEHNAGVGPFGTEEFEMNGIADILIHLSQKTKGSYGDATPPRWTFTRLPRTLTRGVQTCTLPSTAMQAAVKAQRSMPTDLTPTCLLYTSDAADEEDSVDLGGRR